jgi:hypothetical protein
MKPLHWIIPIANEMGFFPTDKQATEINCRAAALYLEYFGGNAPRGHVVHSVHDRTLREAICAVMTEAAQRRKSKKSK